MSVLDKDALRIALTYLMPPGKCVEVRAFDVVNTKGREFASVSGVFDARYKLTQAVAQITAAAAVYVTLNPVDPIRVTNKLQRGEAGGATGSANIVGRSLLLIDCDPQRLDDSGAPLKDQKASTTDAEHSAAISLCDEISCCLDALGWPAPVLADSGNGGHLLYAIDLPTDDNGLIRRVLRALATRFNTNDVHVDTAVFDPARISKLYGTLVCKGDNTTERPHRMSKVINGPLELEVVPASLLELLASEVPNEPDRTPAKPSEYAGTRPGDLYSAVVTWDEILQPLGWKRVSTHVEEGRDVTQWTRPGKSSGVSATTGYCATENRPDCFFSFSSAKEIEPFEPRVSYSKFEAYATTEHGGNHADAAAALAEMGYVSRDDLSSFDIVLPAGTLKNQPFVPFPVETLPSVIKEYVIAATEAIGCDLSYVALPSLSCLARMVGCKRVISPKKTWSEAPIIWTMFVGMSGTKKTPALEAASKFLRAIESQHLNEHESQVMQQTDPLIYDGKSEISVPACERFIIENITTEAVRPLLLDSPDGLLLMRDELAGWFDGMNQYKGGKGDDRAFWLSCHSGKSTRSDRKTGDQRSIIIPRALVSITGGIQPKTLKDIMIREDGTKDGLWQRFLFTMPPRPPVRPWSEEVVDEDLEAAVSQIYAQLQALPTTMDRHLNLKPTVATLTPDAKEVWMEWHTAGEYRVAEFQDQGSEVLSSTYSKIIAYALRLALIFELCEWANGQGSDTEVSKRSLEAGIALSEWFANEARRVLVMMNASADDEANNQLALLIARQPGRRVSARELMRVSSNYRSASLAKLALEKLVREGVGRWEKLGKKEEFVLTQGEES